MLAKFLKKTTNKENKNKFNKINPLSVPFACHYNDNTILTKNGELIQVLKIVGLSAEQNESISNGLREIVRKSIIDSIHDSDVALWVHTIRRKKNLDPGGRYINEFSRKLHNFWCAKNFWKDKYVNELYISIVKQGANLSIKNLNHFISSIFFQRFLKTHREHLQNSLESLNKITHNMLSVLAEYGAEQLGISSRKEGLYSDIISFFYKLINLQDQDIELPIVDLSVFLSQGQILFGNDKLEIYSGDQKQFASILSVKEYKEINTKFLDDFIQLSQEFIISQSIIFNDNNKLLEHEKYQDYILNVSKDQKLKEVLAKPKADVTLPYANNQMTIMFIGQDLQKLEDDILKAVKILERNGQVLVKEDLNLESCFWAQLPGNFSFITRNKNLIYKTQIGGLASLHNFPVGRLYNPWGKSVTLIRTEKGTPYFFNFHLNNNGNTILIGSDNSGKTTLINFLLSESQKYEPNIFYIDLNGKAQSFIEKLNGQYINLSNIANIDLTFNPLAIGDDDIDRVFLTHWISYFIIGERQVSKEALSNIVSQLLLINVKERNMTMLMQILKDNNIEVGDEINNWQMNYAPLFQHIDNSLTQDKIIGYNFNDLSYSSIPIILFIIYKVATNFNNNPTILVMNDNNMLSDTRFVKELEFWLDYFTENNSIMILLSNFNFNNNIDYKNILSKIATNIFMPSSNINAEILQNNFALSMKEIERLKLLKIVNRNFFLKNKQESIFAELNLAGLEEFLPYLSK